MAESSITELREKIKSASMLDSRTVVAPLKQLLRYRRETARILLTCSEPDYEVHLQLYNYINDQIQALLAI